MPTDSEICTAHVIHLGVPCDCALLAGHDGMHLAGDGSQFRWGGFGSGPVQEYDHRG